MSGGADGRSPRSATERYGSAPEQYVDVRIPAGEGPHPVVVLAHGGFWKAEYGLELMDPLADDLVQRGLAVWNLEYRRVGQPGGGYPGTFRDVAAGIDVLADLGVRYELDIGRVAVVGHSAGGHLALWAASRMHLPAGAPGASPIVMPAFIVGLAAVTDLAQAAADELGTRATQRFLGGAPDELSDVYSIAQPVIGAVPTLLVSGGRDDDVPVSYTRRHEGAANVDTVVIEREDHFDVIDPASESWGSVVDALEVRLQAG